MEKIEQSITFSVSEELEKELETVSKEKYKDMTEEEMLRELIKKGIEAEKKKDF